MDEHSEDTRLLLSRAAFTSVAHMSEPVFVVTRQQEVLVRSDLMINLF